MDRRINPFNELYVTETISAAQFVKIFSPCTIELAEELFLPGNVVLKGVQGCGKSMLLELLKPEVRVAYKASGVRFPLTERHSEFISAGINLTLNRAVDVGQRAITDAHDPSTLSSYFADFFNYWVVGDLIRSIHVFATELTGEIARDLRMTVDGKALDNFALELARLNSWQGYLDGVNTLDGLKQRIATRIQTYLRFFNFSISELPEDIRGSRTVVGDPLSDTSGVLGSCGILPDALHILVAIDQYEELAKIESQLKHGPLYRSVIHKALSLRNPHISYRIGTRRYGFNEETLTIAGTEAKLERQRNYQVIDLDELLRKKENTRNWMFPRFAEDVFKKRLRLIGYDVEGQVSCLKKVYGEGSTAEERARTYGGQGRERAVRPDPMWPDSWQSFLRSLASEDPLSARLGEAWARQRRTGKADVVNQLPTRPYPWNRKEAVYWKKERIQAALMQIASRCSQRMIWGGFEDVNYLSGGNILVFVGISKQIWSEWIKAAGQVNRNDSSLPEIQERLQAVGIQQASTIWFGKLVEEPEGNNRQRFASYVGTLLQRELLRDLPLSYPGRTGFSISVEELETDKTVSDFLNDAVDYGALFDAPHTTKEKNRSARRKWYLNPILTPHFGLPYIRTKEPLYVSVEEVHKWIDAAVGQGLDAPPYSSNTKSPRQNKEQALLFGPSEDPRK